jgi:hypothetical protein
MRRDAEEGIGADATWRIALVPLVEGFSRTLRSRAAVGGGAVRGL